jgi:hypothetical protein
VLVELDKPETAHVLHRRRWVHRLTLTAIVAVLAVAVLDGVDVLDAYGVDTRTTFVDTPDGRLVVEHPSVTRPALASPFRVRVEQPGGFDGPITIAVSRPWIEMWDENGFYPTPSGETGDPGWVVWEFDPPDGSAFSFFYDARVEPGRQSGQSGEVQLRDDDGTVLASVDLRTEVRP